MNKEEILNKYINLIDKGYCCACNELNCIDNFPQAKIAHSIRELQQENKQLKEKLNQLETNRDVLKEYIQDLRYNIEPEGVRINFNCEYDSEEDYIRGIEEQAKLEILKAILSKMQELERGKE